MYFKFYCIKKLVDISELECFVYCNVKIKKGCDLVQSDCPTKVNEYKDLCSSVRYIMVPIYTYCGDGYEILGER